MSDLWEDEMAMKKIGIFAPGAGGDLLVSTGVLPYKDKLWPGAKIVWFAQVQFVDLLKHNKLIDEVRDWSGFNNMVLRTPNNRLDQEKKKDYDKVADLDEGYFSVPWLAGAAHWGIPYRDVPRTIFCAPPEWEWHPVLEWTAEEEQAAQAFMDGLPKGRANVMIESHCHSQQSLWNQDTTALVMQRCRARLGECNFILASKEANAEFAPDVDVHDCAAMTLRQIVPVYNRCKLFCGCASGISVATCCWRASEKVVRCIYTGNATFTTTGLARGPNVESYHAEDNLKQRLDEAISLAMGTRT